MTRLELANQLIENQPALHFAFIPVIFGARGEIRASHKADLKSAASSNWATRANVFELVLAEGFDPHCTDLESVVSCQLDYASARILVLPEGVESSITRLSTVRVCQLRHDSNEL